MVKLSLRKYNALNGTDVKLDRVVSLFVVHGLRTSLSWRERKKIVTLLWSIKQRLRSLILSFAGQVLKLDHDDM
ncbi:unnamed protein product [Arabis nemorensis]|uniref:Uncharacterized protein n=1 Tax=Arabis nemorensis TaxID=586526 RepID=A0A565CF50_9BRAS|nr:unnamed protein product [Arabis nemorensis]